MKPNTLIPLLALCAFFDGVGFTYCGAAAPRNVSDSRFHGKFRGAVDFFLFLALRNIRPFFWPSIGPLGPETNGYHRIIIVRHRHGPNRHGNNTDAVALV